MTYLTSLAALLKRTLNKKSTWILFPFTIVAVVLNAAYFIYSTVYMLIDLLVIETRKELARNNENVGVLATAFKYLIFYPVYICFEIARIYMLIPMAIIYFTIDIFLFVSSLGSVKENPFIFHNL